MSVPVVGHTTTRLILERDLPTVALLVGPEGTGKWTLVRHLNLHHRVAMVDRLICPSDLSIDEVRRVTEYTRRSPYGPFKLISLNLDGASRPALNALLKTLEEPPPRVKFLLTSSQPLLPTVMSRCVVYRLGLLTVAELTKVLIQQGLTAARAAQAARQGRGQVSAALAADKSNNTARQTVLDVVRAMATTDRDLFDRAFGHWDISCNDLLATWITEALTCRPTLFSDDEFFGLNRHRERLLDIAIAVTRLPSARPKLGVRAALEPFTVRR